MSKEHSNTHTILRRHIDRIPQITASDERRDLLAYAQGDVAAGQRVVAGNVRFVLRVASRYAAKGSDRFDEVVAAGLHGLAHALPLYDAKFKVRFITHARYHIQVKIERYLKRMPLVPMPFAGPVRHAAAVLRSRGASSASDLAESAKVSLEDAGQAWLSSLPSAHFMDDGVDSNGKRCSWDNEKPADPNVVAAADPEGSVDASRTAKAVRMAVEKLNDVERVIVERRVLAEKPATLQAIGNELGFSRQYAQKVEIRALGKLRLALGHLREAA